MYNKYKARGLKVIYFDLDDDHKIWEQEIKKYNLKWTNVSEGVIMKNSKICKAFNLDHVPVYILINKKGKIVYNSDNDKGHRLISLDENIKKAIN